MFFLLSYQKKLFPDLVFLQNVNFHTYKAKYMYICIIHLKKKLKLNFHQADFKYIYASQERYIKK